MPRPAVPPEKRRRVARACDSCKRRKERCNGIQPCSICMRRSKTHECHFSDTPARLLRPGGGFEAESTSTQPDRRESKDGIAINRLLNEAPSQPTLDPSLNTNLPPRTLSTESNGEVPDYARLLRDGEGKYMYIGDSASLSFLQSVRRIVALAVGDCEFTTDAMRHSILETSPAHPMMPSNEHLPLTYENVAYLARQYLLATAGLMDIFDVENFWPDLEDWVNSPSRDMHQRSCIFYLVIAIGAQVSYDESQQSVAEQYFSRGRQQAFYNFTEAPSLMTVQVYSLITVYMLGACRRNGAFMNFGIAIRATVALGMHIHSTHGIFDDKESRDRRQTWTSVRILDSFFAASLGRPPATADPTLPTELDPPKKVDGGDFSQKVLELSAIYDRIVTEVYLKKAVSTRLAESISQQLRTWTQGLPKSLNLQTFPLYDESRLSEILAATHIISSYHWAIILLTRPFLTSQILQDMARKKAASKAGHPPVKPDDPAIKTFADACVDSALKGLGVIESLLKYRTLPRRLPVLINAVCNIALVLGAAVFADQDKNFPLIVGLEQALNVLRHFTPHDPHASRYAQIISYLSGAVKNYIQQRDRLSMELRSKEVSQLFGSVGQYPATESAERQQTPIAGPTPSDSEAQESSATPGFATETYDPATPVSFGRAHNDISELLTFANHAGAFPDAIQPPSSIFGDAQMAFPNDAYLFMEQEPSIFSFWSGS